MAVLDVSVVIPTHNRREGLARLLEALRRQTLDSSRFEAIVVDDGSREPVSVNGDGLQVRVLRHEQSRGPAAARNAGWREARAETVAFIDDDCTPERGWLEAVVKAADGPQAVIQGPILPLPGELRQPLSHTIEVAGPTRLFVSANIAYPRTLLARLGGFDERFMRACAEDVELGARALKAGAAIRFAAGAVVYHEVRDMGLPEHIRHTAQWTDAAEALAMHPELRDLLFLRIFWKPTHPWLIATALALPARRARLASIVLAPYLLRYVSIYRGDPRVLARALPKHLVIDICEIATAVTGSIRHRTLML